MDMKFNSKDNLVPFQSLSESDQYKLIALYGNPRETQCMGNSGAGKTDPEMDTPARLCKIEPQHQLPRKTTKALCEICSQLSPENLSSLPSYFHLTGNGSGHMCLCQMFDRINRDRKQIGMPQISRSQACKLMQDVLVILKCGDDNKQRFPGRSNSTPKHLISNV
ncbi:MAG: hypothetical protein PHQ65_03715 [Bacteroidales bacterium]|nr:hypothetical protein [Bacteroidales bacterium]MDD3664349.1 hypothetical protein [Bacteroidales bacterium]